MGATEMAFLRFYGGVGEIGGNKILLEDDDKKIFLDFGMSFKQRKKFYSNPYLSPRKGDREGMIVTGLLPDIKGVYEFDPEVKQVDAVLLSHAHADHARYISFLMRSMLTIPKDDVIEDFLKEGTPLLSNEKLKQWIREDSSAQLALISGYPIPAICSRKTARIIRALHDPQPEGCSRKGFETDIEGLKIHGIDYSGRFKTSEYIQAFPVNHSIDGTTAWIINSSDGAIVYTGDFREGELTNEFIKNAKNSKPRVMICEGTNIGSSRHGLKSEEQVEEKIDEIISNHGSRSVFVDFADKDTSRLMSLVRLAEKHDRFLIVSPRLVHLTMALRELDTSIPDIEKNDKIMVYKKRKETLMGYEKRIFENKTFERRIIEETDLQKNQGRYLVCFSFYDLKNLVGIKPSPGSAYIISHSEAFDEEGEIEERILYEWLRLFKLKPYKNIHVSGHVFPEQLEKIIEIIKPKTVIPVHTEHPEKFKELVSGNVLCPKEGLSYPLG